jgi:hypothetical protein
MVVEATPAVTVTGDVVNTSLFAAAGFTVSVKLCVAFGEMPFAAVIVIGYVPLAVAVPPSRPEVELSVTPAGNEPVSLNVIAVGEPLVVTVNEPAVPAVNVVLLALVIAGA